MPVSGSRATTAVHCPTYRLSAVPTVTPSMSRPRSCACATDACALCDTTTAVSAGSSGRCPVSVVRVWRRAWRRSGRRARRASRVVRVAGRRLEQLDLVVSGERGGGAGTLTAARSGTESDPSQQLASMCRMTASSWRANTSGARRCGAALPQRRVRGGDRADLPRVADQQDLLRLRRCAPHIGKRHLVGLRPQQQADGRGVPAGGCVRCRLRRCGPVHGWPGPPYRGSAAAPRRAPPQAARPAAPDRSFSGIPYSAG